MESRQVDPVDALFFVCLKNLFVAKVMKDLSFLNNCNRRKGLYDGLTLPNPNPLEIFHPNICFLLFRLQRRDSFNKSSAGL